MCLYIQLSPFYHLDVTYMKKIPCLPCSSCIWKQCRSGNEGTHPSIANSASVQARTGTLVGHMEEVAHFFCIAVGQLYEPKKHCQACSISTSQSFCGLAGVHPYLLFSKNVPPLHISIWHLGTSMHVTSLNRPFPHQYCKWQMLGRQGLGSRQSLHRGL